MLEMPDWMVEVWNNQVRNNLHVIFNRPPEYDHPDLEEPVEVIEEGHDE